MVSYGNTPSTFVVLGKITNAPPVKSIEFKATVDDTGKISVPASAKDALRGKKVKVTLSYDSDDDPSSPDEVHYTKGYDQKDTLYDKY